MTNAPRTPTRKPTPSAKEADMTTTLTPPAGKADANRQRAAAIAKAKAAKPKSRRTRVAPVVTSHVGDGLGVADLAVMCNTTPRAMRAFLRSTDQGTGKGSRYVFTTRQVDRIVKAFNAR